jgi:transmembrane sensor
VYVFPSTMDLNSASQVRVRFSAHERNVELLKGQALFRVVKDPARPFVC